MYEKGDTERVIEWLTEHNILEGELEKFIGEIFGRETELTEEIFGLAVEALIFEGKYQGVSFLEYFLNHAILSSWQKEKYLNWLRLNKFSFFEVLSISRGQNVRLRDLFSQDEYLVTEHQGTMDMPEKVIIAGRILPSGNTWVFSGGMLTQLPDEFSYLFQRTSSITKQVCPPQANFLQVFYGKKDTSEESSYEQLKSKLKTEIENRHIAFDVNSLDEMISGKAKIDMEKINTLLGSSCSNEKEYEDLVKLLDQTWQFHPKFKDEKYKPGPKEELLTRQMMFEAGQQYFKALPPKEAKEALNDFTQKWFKTPQKELNNKTPEEVIFAEREARGYPRPKLTYNFSLTKVPFSPKTSGDQPDNYNLAIYYMNQKQDYYQALLLLAKIAQEWQEFDESFRYFCNVGVCLVSLGEMELGKKYFDKSLSLFSGYEVAKNNLKNFQDPEIVKQMRFYGQETLFFEIFKHHSTHLYLSFKDNPLIKDAVSFLNYVFNNKVNLTKVRRDIGLARILKLNSELVEPGPEVLTFGRGGKSISFTNREEIQFYKVYCLHHLFLALSFVKERKNRLLLTPKGRQFLKLSPPEQFEALFESYFAQLNWSVLIGGGWAIETLEKRAEILQGACFNFLKSLKGFGNQKISSLEIVKKLFSFQTGNQEDLEPGLLTNAANKFIFDFLVWAEILRDTLPKKTKEDLLESLSDKDHFLLTPFGKQVIEQTEKAMHEAIPSIFRSPSTLKKFQK